MRQFQKAVFFYNPFAGKGKREEEVRRVAEILRPLSGSAELVPTESAGGAGAQAAAAIERGCDLVFACGGDGTVFDILQGVVGTHATLAVVPFGTGNVLAHDLGLGGKPEQVARQLLECTPTRIAVGKIHRDGWTRYFTVAGGVGVHAYLIYNSVNLAKGTAGIGAYYLSGFDLLFRHKFIPFEVTITGGEGHTSTEQTNELVAMRVSSFGRWLKRWKPGSDLRSPSMQLVLLGESSRFSMVRYALEAIIGTAHRTRRIGHPADVRIVEAVKVVCRAIPGVSQELLRAQADGEMLRITLPLTIEMVPDAVSLLMKSC